MIEKGKGGSLLAVAQVIYMTCGYLMHIAITRLLGPDDYGTWGILLALLGWFELSLMQGFPKWTTRNIARESDEEKIQQIKSISILGQGIATLVMAILFYSLAIPFSRSLNDSALGILIKISSIDILIYGMYFLNLGIINGKKEYKRMFVLICLYAVSKTTFVTLFIYFGHGIVGAVIANILSSVTVFSLSCFWIGRISFTRSDRYRLRDFFSFGIPSTVFILGFVLLHQIDFFMLKALAPDKDVIGYYLLAMMLAKVPFYLVDATSKSLFSEMCFHASALESEKNSQVLNSYIYATLLIFSLIATVTLTSTKELILLIFPSIYLNSVPFLKILILSNVMVGGSFLMSQVLFVYKKERLASVYIFLMLVFAIPINYILIKLQGPNGAAMASAIVFLINILFITLITRHFVSIRLPWKLLLRVLPAMAATALFNVSFDPISRMGYFGELTLGTLIFGSVLWIFREPYLISTFRKIKG